MATPGYAALYRVPGAQQTSSMNKAPEENIGEEKAPTMGLQTPGVPDEVRSNGQPQMMFDPSRARYAYGGMAQGEEKILDDTGYRAYEEGGIVLPELQDVQEAGMPIDIIAGEDLEEEIGSLEDIENMGMEEDLDSELSANVSTSMLSSKQELILENAIEEFPELINIIPKMLMISAENNSNESTEEFTGEGEVDGPGTGTSDSIPAMLSDGEFVITAKAVKQIGVDKLRKLMKKAEDDYDKDMNVQDEQQMESVPSDVMSAAYGGLMKNPYK